MATTSVTVTNEEGKPTTTEEAEAPIKETKAEAIVADLDFKRQFRENLTTFIPLLIVSLMITGAGVGLTAQAALDILATAANDTDVYNNIKGGTVPKTTLFISGTIITGFGVFVLMVVTVTYLDRRERIDNRRKIIEEEQRLQKLKAKPKNIFEVLLSAARGNAASKSPQPPAASPAPVPITTTAASAPSINAGAQKRK